MRTTPFVALLLAISAASYSTAEQQPRVTGANFPLAEKFNREFVNQHLQVASVTPTFIGKTDQFWYGVRSPLGTKYYRVDPARKSKEPLFDSIKLAAMISESLKKPIDTDTLAITRLTVTDDGTKMRFVHSDTQFEFEFASSKLSNLGRAAPEPRAFPKGNMDDRTRELIERQREERERQEKDGDRRDEEKKDEEKKEEEKKDTEKKEEGKADPKKGGFATRPGDYKAYSPDRKRYAFLMNYNLYLAEEGKESEAIQLSKDGEEKYSFSSTGTGRFGTRGGSTTTTESKIPPSDRKTRPNVTWSPDSKSFFITRTDGRNVQELYLVNPLGDPRPTLMKYPYPMPGEENVFKSELHYYDATAKKLTRVPPKWAYERYLEIHWNKSGDELRYVHRDRLQRNLEFCSLNTKTGETKCLISEGFDAAFLDYQNLRYVEESDEFIWWSERSGWAHYYLYSRNGEFKNAITSGSWRASRIVSIDGKNRLLYFVGNGREPGENIYYNHLYRVRFDGSDLTCLDPSSTCFASSEPGCQGANHTSYLSPTRRFVVTTCSRVDFAPMSYVLDEKGNRVMDLEQTDLSTLLKTGWKLPETFCVKAADGVTTLYGNMWKPFDFDPKKKYPIIAHVYPGPQTEGVTHTFSAISTNQQLAQLGFIVVQVGHRGGTPDRSKAYHSYGYFNLRDYALADKKAAIEQLAARHTFIDIERVGIYGHSGGGFLSAAALLQKPYNEFFKAAVASAGNHDNNIYNDNWSERYHGLKEVPVDAKDAKDSKERRGRGIPPARPDDEELPGEDKPQDKKEEVKKAEEKKAEAKTEEKKAEAKKEDVKKAETKTEEKKTEEKNVEAKKEEVKKAEEKKAESKKEEVKKGEEKKTEEKNVEAKKEEPKTKFEIKVPTNAELAANLKGHILLVHGDMDNNVHPANTMRLVDALIKANKRFDMLILPGKAHGFADYQPYFTNRMWDFFAEHLLGDRQTAADIQQRNPGRK